jgi:hypothetical protein
LLCQRLRLIEPAALADGVMSETLVTALRGNWLFPTQVGFGSGRIGELAELCTRVRLSTVVELGLRPGEFDAVTRLAATDICAGPNPVPIDAASPRAILEAAS